MSVFQVELKKVVDDSYEIEIGYQLENRLIEDLKNGLVGKIKKFAVITDSTVKELYADHIVTILSHCQENFSNKIYNIFFRLRKISLIGLIILH